MPVKYNNKFIIPAPFASIDMTKNRAGDGTQINNEFSITLSGSFLSWISGVYSTYAEDVSSVVPSEQAMTKLLEKQNELRNLFAIEGMRLEIIGWDDELPVIFYPRVESINFGEGLWVQKCDYTISLVASRELSDDAGPIPNSSVYGEFSDYRVTQAVDNYTMENKDDGTADINRDINANGAVIYASGSPGTLLMFPWQQASGWCETIDSPTLDASYSGVVNSVVPSFTVVDTKVSKNLDRLGGVYSIARGWMVSNTGVYTVNKSSTRNETANDEINKTLDLSLNINGVGYTSGKKYSNASTYWSDKGITTRADKITQIKAEFSDEDANDGTWHTQTYGEVNNKQEGTLSHTLTLAGYSGVMNSYTINTDTNWIDLPQQTLSINGVLTGQGDTATDKKNSALVEYGSIDFAALASGVSVTEFGSGVPLYLQNQSINVNNDTGEVGYARNYVSYEQNYQDRWTLDYSQNETGGADTLSLNGELIGLSPQKDIRWTQVYSAFNSNFQSDSGVWNEKVATVLGVHAPASRAISSRSFSHNSINGSIGYSYQWSTLPTSGETDYSISCGYDRESDSWTITTDGTTRGAGTTVSDKLNNALQIVPHENEAWQHTYLVAVSGLDDNSTASDSPRITQIENQRYLTNRSFNANELEGLITFSFTWNTSAASSGYKDVFTTDYSWDDKSATEIVRVDGTITGYKTGSETPSNNVANGWSAVYNNGDPACPASVFAARHTTKYADQSNTSEVLPVVYPISSSPTPTSVLSFNRSATLSSITYAKADNKDEINYSFEYIYRAWPYSLPLWFTDVSISFNKNKSQDIWVQKPIIGKLTGPIHQDLTARSSESFDVSIGISTTKRKADQFGVAIGTLLEEYSEYILRQVFLERSGYTSFNYGRATEQNCHLEGDSISHDKINGSLQRTVKIVMHQILD